MDDQSFALTADRFGRFVHEEACLSVSDQSLRRTTEEFIAYEQEPPHQTAARAVLNKMAVVDKKKAGTEAPSVKEARSPLFSGDNKNPATS